MKTFDKQLIDTLRKICHRVYVDTKTDDAYIGKLDSYTGDRVRIFLDGWEFEESTICYSDDDLRAVLKEFEAEAEDCGLTFEEMWLS